MTIQSPELVRHAIELATDVFVNQDFRPFRAAFVVRLGENYAVLPLLDSVDPDTMRNAAQGFISDHSGSSYVIALSSPAEGKAQRLHLTYVDEKGDQLHLEAPVVDQAERGLGTLETVDAACDEIGYLLTPTPQVRPL